MYSDKIIKQLAEEFNEFPETKIGDKTYSRTERARELCAGEVLDFLAGFGLSYREAKTVLIIAQGALKDRAMLQERSREE